MLAQVNKTFWPKNWDSVEGQVRAPKKMEKGILHYYVSKINFEDPEKVRHKIAFDNLTPLYPNSQLVMESEKTKVEKLQI